MSRLSVFYCNITVERNEKHSTVICSKVKATYFKQLDSCNHTNIISSLPVWRKWWSIFFLAKTDTRAARKKSKTDTKEGFNGHLRGYYVTVFKEISDLAAALCQALPGNADVQSGVYLVPPPLGVGEVGHLLIGGHQAVSPGGWEFLGGVVK